MRVRKLSGLGYAESWDEQLEDSKRGDVGQGSHGEDEHGVKRKVMGDYPSEDRSARGTRRTAETNDRTDARGGEHIRRG